MPFRRGRRFAPLQSTKHEITWSNLAQNASAIQNITLVNGVEEGTATTGTATPVGQRVNGIYLEFHFSAETITTAKVIHWTVEAIRTGQTSPVPSLYNQSTRSQIIKRGMEMLPKSVSTVFKRIVFVRIPPKYARVSSNLDINFRYIATSAETINACGIAIYKALK